MNTIDPRGTPFKQRIVNYILGLRPSLRDPLVKKINEICLQQEGSKAKFIDESEMELSIATKHRAVSLGDVRRSQTGSVKAASNNLPQIGLPGIKGEPNNNRPTIVLPHSEPLSEESKTAQAELISLFGLELMTCFNSQTWSSRQCAIQKVEEQLNNLDPNLRDAMYGEINRNNIPPEISFKSFVVFVEAGLKDPVLKNYIAVLELIQKALPVYFRYLKPDQVKRDLIPLVSQIVIKTSDLKQKVREASMNFCLYLSH